MIKLLARAYAAGRPPFGQIPGLAAEARERFRALLRREDMRPSFLFAALAYVTADGMISLSERPITTK